MQRIKQLIVIASQHMHPWGWTCFTWSSESLLHSGSRLENQALIFEALVLACLSMLPRFDQCRPIILLRTKRRRLLSTWDLSTLGVRLGVGSALRVGVGARVGARLCVGVRLGLGSVWTKDQSLSDSEPLGDDIPAIRYPVRCKSPITTSWPTTTRMQTSERLSTRETCTARTWADMNACVHEHKYCERKYVADTLHACSEEALDYWNM